MSSQDTMFLVQIAVEELKIYSTAKNYKIRVRFGDIFKLQLKDPNELMADAIKSRLGGKKKRKIKPRQGVEAQSQKTYPSVQTAIVVSDVDSLLNSMLIYPIELSLFSKDDPFVFGVAEIPWSEIHKEYVKSIEQNPNQPPAILTDTYKTYDEYTSKRVANVKMSIKISLLEDTRPTQIHKMLGKSIMKASTEPVTDASLFAPGTIKTIYHGGKQKKNKHEHKVDNEKVQDTKEKESTHTINELNRDEVIEDICNIIYDNSADMQDHITNCIQSHYLSVSKQSLNNSHKKNERSITSLLGSQTQVQHDNSNNSLNNYHKKNERSITSLVRSQTQLQEENLINSNKKNDRTGWVRSQTQLQQGNTIQMTKHWSTTSVEIKERLDTLNYIFGNPDGPFGNQVYCVGYFTVECNGSGGGGGGSIKKEGTSGKSSGRSSPNVALSEKTSKAGSMSSTAESQKYTFNICGNECPFGGSNPCFENVCEIDLPESARKIVDMTKCSNTECYYKKDEPLLVDPEVPIVVDFGTSRATKDCCVEKVEQVVGGMSAKLTDDPCYCACECRFGFVRKTLYCRVCGGYEVPGDIIKPPKSGPPFPCPIYHGLVKNKKGKTPLSKDTSALSSKSKASNNEDATIEDRKLRKDPRFKFNYGYKGIPPQIGHSQCGLACGGDMQVPKNMGWLWTANNIPGLKVRPGWRPGAANKHVVRMLRIARFPEEEQERRKKNTGKKKKALKRPLLTVQKKDGEYHVTMETMKTFTKPRLVNQHPYEDKPLVCFTVGRTEAENAERQKRKERAQRRLEREQRAFLKSAFQDMCKEICLKTYEQALGLLPFADDSFCPCYPEIPPPDRVDSSHSCSCADSEMSSASATDDDEWIVEFTPPNAYFDPTSTVKKTHTSDNSTQHDYRDYRVKLLDPFGNEYPRFFIGPTGKQECSDLGGFWGPDGKWIEINEDGIIGPDGRWAPNSFIGPCGEQVEADNGRFQTTNGVWLTCGIDGYIDTKGRWHFHHSNQKPSKDPKKQRNVEDWMKAGGCRPTGERRYAHAFGGGGGVNKGKKQSEATWSCFGDASPRTLSQMGIAGHGHDRRLLLSTLERLMKQGEDVKFPHRPTIPKSPAKQRKKKRNFDAIEAERLKCRHGHAGQTSKGIVAVSDHGHKTYFTLKDPKNMRPKQRIQMLDEEGYALSSFHVPCFSSFISSEAARQQQLEHILQHNARVMESGVQTGR